MTPARRRKLEQALDLIRDVNDADAWGTLTAETRATLAGFGAEFMDAGQGGFIRFEGVSASCDFDRVEHLLLRWAANARVALAEAEVMAQAPLPTSGYAEIRDLPTEEEE